MSRVERRVRRLYPELWKLLLAASNAEEQHGAEAAIPHLRRAGRRILDAVGSCEGKRR